uniref:Uncharacterized protein n=1 Tax=Lactuca sativa TaxID=4236 RepID=A0A9R1WGE3_LACSA|nr:hypothetical protein LSAT_V11C200090480 [Lactuca sativa]
MTLSLETLGKDVYLGVYPDYTEEPSALASWGPNVCSMLKFGYYISRDVYIGSANNDRKSLTQVKEVGIYLVSCPDIAKKVEIFYNNLWKLGSLNSSDYTLKIWDQ